MKSDSSSDPAPDRRDADDLAGDVDWFRDPDPPEAIGPYRVVRLLGSGSMGTVFEVEATDGRRLAVKVMKEGSWRKVPELQRRFLREVNAAMRVDHPNVVRMLGIERCRHAGIFAVMELVRGPTMDAVTRAATDPPARLKLLVDVARGIAAAHERKVVHRDVKPQNVIVDSAGTARVTDFGLARILDGTRYTGTSVALGTPGYMAPEQMRGLLGPLLRSSAIPGLRNASAVARLVALGSSDVDAPADVWALGVMLYELMTSRHPFPGPIDRTLDADVRPATIVSSWPARLVSPLAPVCLKALSKAPQLRWRDAGEFTGALELALDGSMRGYAVGARPWTLKEKLKRLRTRRP